MATQAYAVIETKPDITSITKIIQTVFKTTPEITHSLDTPYFYWLDFTHNKIFRSIFVNMHPEIVEEFTGVLLSIVSAYDNQELMKQIATHTGGQFKSTDNDKFTTINKIAI